MYERHGDEGSSRYRDLADLLLISQQETVDGPTVYQAVHQEAELRRQRGVDLDLPKNFEAPGAAWPRYYPAAAALVIGLQGCRTFPEAAQAAETFFNPLLDGSVRGNWDPGKGRHRPVPGRRPLGVRGLRGGAFITVSGFVFFLEEKPNLI
ncbi:hypothetical protein ACFQ9Z_16765 [Streptomyces sp. NPDC056580]|uniref:hypothetical protein n=1 Tax=Streptomyces sp. NPDC056580 TaxID=3345872 RepID=UPI0036C55FF1